MAYTRLGPFQDGGAPYLSAATFNHLEDGIAVGAAQGITCPPPTGTAATDDANIRAAITAAQAAATNLYLPATNGVYYKMLSGITWDLTRGSIIGAGTDFDFGNLTTGAAITVTGPGSSSNGGYTAHRSTVNKISSLNLIGYGTSTVDGIYINDTFGVDGGTIESVMLNGFRDGLTYGNNVWLIRHEKVGVGHFSRYAVNLTVGTNAGENIAFYDCVFYSGSAAGAVAVYSPANTNTDARFIACSFDYNTLEGLIQGGNIVFEACHIEDNSAGPMFQYSATSGQNPVSVVFRDCLWDSSATALRDHLHEITASTSSNISIAFDGVTGGVGGTVNNWLVNNSGQTDNNVRVSVDKWAITAGSSANMTLGDPFNLLVNGSFDESSTFVATPGIRGWFASGASTYQYSGGVTGNGLRVVNVTAASGTAQQRVPIANRRPVRVAGWMATTAYTSGSIGLYVQFYGEDGTTTVGSQIRVGPNDVASLTGGTTWQHNSVRLVPPKGAAYLMVLLNAVSFAGTGYWDNVEVVPV